MVKLISTVSVDGEAADGMRMQPIPNQRSAPLTQAHPMSNPQRFQEVLAGALDSSRWQLIMLPTEQCNFRCTYCYETFKNRMMSDDTVKGIKNLISRRLSGLQSLNVQWFGGEPLLARRVIRNISHWILKIKPPALHFNAGMTTNGYLLDSSCLAEMCRLGVYSYQVSLDGWEQEHDRTRVRCDGSGTFNRVWSNLLAARDSDEKFQITLRLHMRPDNFNSLKKLIDEINHAFGDDSRFRVFLKAIGCYGGAGDSHNHTYSPKEERRAKQELQSLLRMKSCPLSLSSDSPYICYAAKPNSLVIRSTGRIAKCTVALEHSSNDVGFLKPNGTLALINEKVAPWIAGFGDLDRTKLACPWTTISKGNP